MGCSIDSAINYSDMLECPQPAVGGEWQAIPGKEAIPCIIILMTWCYWANTLSVIDITISDQSFRGGHVWKHYLSRGSFCALFHSPPPPPPPLSAQSPGLFLQSMEKYGPTWCIVYQRPRVIIEKSGEEWMSHGHIDSHTGHGGDDEVFVWGFLSS